MLKLPCLSVGRGVIQALNALAPDILARRSALVQFSSRNTRAASCSRGAAQSGVTLARNGSLHTSGADIDSALVGRVPVARSWGVLRQRQVGLGLLDLLGLVGVLFDDGLAQR